MKLAREFRKWLVHEVIPSLIQTGTYSIPSVAMQQQLHELQVQNQELKLRLEHETSTVTNPIIGNQSRNILPMEELYIMSTLQYEPKYIYKLGHSDNTPKRLVSLNTSHLKQDELFICYRARCVDSANTEKYLHKLLDRFRAENNREFFVILFDTLRYLVDMACEAKSDLYEKSVKVLDNELNRTLPSTNTHITIKHSNGSIVPFLAKK